MPNRDSRGPDSSEREVISDAGEVAPPRAKRERPDWSRARSDYCLFLQAEPLEKYRLVIARGSQEGTVGTKQGIDIAFALHRDGGNQPPAGQLPDFHFAIGRS